MPTQIESDVTVQRLGFTQDERGTRLVFPRADLQQLEGRSGTTNYGAMNCHFDHLEGRFGPLMWKAAASTIGSVYLRDDGKVFDVTAQNLDLPNGIRMTRAEKGIELIAPSVTLSDLKVVANGPFGSSTDANGAAAPPPAAAQPTLQDKLRFLDSLSGHVNLTVQVKLDLPVLGNRTLDQSLEVPIQEGSIDFRALDKSLDWLEGAFLDIGHDNRKHKLSISWKVPIFGSAHDLISWQLDKDAEAIAAFGRVPVRALVDYQFGEGSKEDKKGNGKSKILSALSIDAIDIALSLLAPRSVDVGHGMIMFGGDDEPGMVDLKVSGAIHDTGPGALKGAMGKLDTTLSDVSFGSVQVSADRLQFDGIDQLVVAFDGFKPTKASMIIKRVSASNLQLRVGR